MSKPATRTQITYRLNTGIYTLTRVLPTTAKSAVEAEIVALMGLGAIPASIAVTHY